MRAASARDRAAAAAVLGHTDRLSLEQQRELDQLIRSDDDARVRAVALGAFVRAGPRRAAAAAWRVATEDADATVRRRAAEVAPALGTEAPASALIALLGDDDALTAEAAAFALGERVPAGQRALAALRRAAVDHEDALVRESAVAALGAIGDPGSLPVVLAACDDKPAVRRRAVLALAAFDGPEVEARLRVALTDRDWQVRQAAEDLLHESDASEAPDPSGAS
jgi:HEAT repeat protein